MNLSNGQSGRGISGGVRVQAACGALLVAICGLGLSVPIDAQRADVTKSRPVKAASQVPGVFHTRDGHTARVVRRVPGETVLSFSDRGNRAAGTITVIAPPDTVEIGLDDLKPWISVAVEIVRTVADIVDDLTSQEDGDASGGNARPPKMKCTITYHTDGRVTMTCVPV
jgi:hypothetical protein